MKIRQHSNYKKPNEWKDFIRDMDLWIMVYDALTFLSKQKIMGVLALKAHIQNSEMAYEEILSPKELSFFKEVLAAKTRDYDPDSELKAWNEKVVCVELNPRSYIAEKVSGTTVCGKFLGLNKGKAQTKIMSDDGSAYEDKEAAFSFRLAYPDGAHEIDISLLDLVNLEPFI